MSPQTHNPIQILGAGLSGLTLSRCLAKKGISSILYEKTQSPASHNYAITLYPYAYRPLLKILGLDESIFQRRVAVDSANGGEGRVYSRMDDQGAFRAHRGKLESLLRESLDIEWSHNLKETPLNSGMMIFDKGKSILSTFTVDTTGVHSPVRTYLSQLKILPFVVFRGTRRISGADFKNTFAPYFKDGNIVETKKDVVLLQISINNYMEDLDSVDISYIYLRPAHPSGHDPLYKPSRALNEAKDISEEFYTEISKQTKLDSPFKEVFDVQKMRGDRILNWLTRSSLVPLGDLIKMGERNLMMLGDAVHAMPILGGNAANVAILDALALAEWIADGRENVREFYEGRYRGWEEAVREAEKNLHMAGM